MRDINREGATDMHVDEDRAVKVIRAALSTGVPSLGLPRRKGRQIILEVAAGIFDGDRDILTDCGFSEDEVSEVAAR